MVQELPRRTIRAALWAALPLVLALGCRGEAPRTPDDTRLAHLVDSLVPEVERGTGLKFTSLPRSRMLSRAEMRTYLVEKLQSARERDRLLHMQASYKLFGLVPDSVDLERMYLDVLTEQVAGVYDPDSSAFFGVREAAPQLLSFTVAHELMHALQHNYVPLDSLMNDPSDADQLFAARAVLEGQATFAMFRMRPEIDQRVLEAAFWDEVRDQIRAQLTSMPALATAPRIVREELVLPYIAGAEYIRWWATTQPTGSQPYGVKMPRSSEAIFDPVRAERGDPRLAVAFTPAGGAEYTNVLGAVGMRVLLAERRGQGGEVEAAVLGWGGDRYAMYATPEGDALVWIAVFDAAPARDAMFGALERPGAPDRPGYRRRVEKFDVSGRPGLRYVVAPTGWERWSALPTATAAPAP